MKVGPVQWTKRAETIKKKHEAKLNILLLYHKLLCSRKKEDLILCFCRDYYKQMRSFLALVVFTTSFALLLNAANSFSRQRPYLGGSSRLFESSSSSASSRRKNELIVSILEDGEDEDESSSEWDPSDVFHGKGESPVSDLLLEDDDDVALKKVFFNDQSVKSIVRDLDGYPLSTDYFAKTMGVKDNVESYTCPEKDAFRGFMSNGCRVQLVPGGETAFYKRIVFEHLGHAREKMKQDPFKLVRDSKSYQVVASFLSSKACETLIETTGVHIPKCYDAQLQPNDVDPIQSKFSFLLEDLHPSDGWYQQWLIDDITECQTTLSTYAKIHAYFWSGSSFWKKDDVAAAEEFEKGVWKSGSYVQPKAQNPNQCKIVATEWKIKRMKFEKQLSSFDYWDNLGERLESICEHCGIHAHPFAYDDDVNGEYQKYRTFTHGDPKQANLFFRKNKSKLVEVGLIDFQWAGFGLAASDIAHFLTSAVHADQLVNGGEDRLRRYYFDELQKYLVEYGAFRNADDAIENYTYETFITQYDTAVLDICRLGKRGSMD